LEEAVDLSSDRLLIIMIYHSSAAPESLGLRKLSFPNYVQLHTAVGNTPMDEGSARRKDLPDNIQHSQETDIHASQQDSNPQSQQAISPRPSS
jgi:hypothetical protein